jgi:hypothetical protein
VDEISSEAQHILPIFIYIELYLQTALKGPAVFIFMLCSVYVVMAETIEIVMQSNQMIDFEFKAQKV